MDLNAACAGFTYGLVTAAGLIATGVDRILLVGAETLTRATNWSTTGPTPSSSATGPAPWSSRPSPGQRSLLGWDLGVDGPSVPILYADHGEGMVMKGQEVFRRAVRADGRVGHGLSMERAKVTVDDIALFVPHQANIRIMDAVADRLGLPRERIASVIDETGNTSSASIPLALVDAAERRPPRRRRPGPPRRLRRRDDLGVGRVAVGSLTPAPAAGRPFGR